MEFQSLFMELFPILPSSLHGPLLLLFPFLSLPLTHLIKSINLSCPPLTLSKKPPSLRMEKRLWKLSWPRIFSSGKAGMVGRVGARVLEHCCIPFLSFPFSLSSPPSLLPSFFPSFHAVHYMLTTYLFCKWKFLPFNQPLLPFSLLLNCGSVWTPSSHYW